MYMFSVLDFTGMLVAVTFAADVYKHKHSISPTENSRARPGWLWIRGAFLSLPGKNKQTEELKLIIEWLVALSECKKGSPYLITERRVSELFPVLRSQPAGDVSHKPSGRLLLLSARPAVTPATLKRASTNFAAWWTEAQWVWTVCLRLLPNSVVAAILTPGPSVPESSTLTTQLPSHPLSECTTRQLYRHQTSPLWCCSLVS